MRPRLRACLITASLLALAACGGQPAPAGSSSATPATREVASSPTPAPAAGRDLTLMDVQTTQSVAEPAYEVVLDYPRFVDEADPSNAKFNTIVSDLTRDLSEDFVASAAPPPDLDPSLLMTSTLGMTYSVSLINNDLVSVLFEISTYNAGAAHPLGSFRSLNYDRNAAAPLELAALFAKDAPYLERIAAYCAKDLAAKGALEFPEGAEPKPENFQKWNITDQGLLITFDPYQVAPYVAGPQQVAIPRAELQDILATDSPLKATK